VAELLVSRNDFAECEVAVGETPSRELADDEAQLRVECFGLSTNNVTYAALGEEIGYWRAFPAPEGWGRVPAWGYARVTRSRSPAVAEGQRVFGFVPMASYVTVRPSPLPIGFFNTTPERASFAPVYNQYVWVPEDAGDLELIMRPLFGTSVALDLALGEADPAGAQAVVLTSASSKTAYGLAHLLGERRVSTTGLTSPARRAFVEGIGLYEAVLAYDEADDLAPSGDVVLVDFAGDRRLLRRLHERLGEKLVRSLSVGFTHRQGGLDEAPLPGPAPEFFFVPDELARRGREVAQRYAEAWPAFGRLLERALHVERVTDAHELARVWRAVVGGETDAATGYVVSLEG
jgi:Protein of unknown function (DUF2855)